ncbi:hypothetical protein BOTBODRAFT_32737 [Botryobasidium botryosum FD-172 SS1]|uniref:FIST domain-containing protein n=1 Tax=Botryobasidium botryosum (strain FD-172 SS1) TaxID=930990 RepID=A0A067MER0_BOTB1|nr:hypothetical protein BOTBODRAFT_32737 [Botryobasidium botryosum FD-172 SS1]
MMPPSATTFLARSSSALLRHLSALPPPPPASLAFYALSSNATDLQPLVSHLSSLSKESIGCLSSPLPPSRHSAAPISCAIAYFPLAGCVGFRSEILGHRKAQVGRWHRPGADTRHAQQDMKSLEHALGDSSQKWGDLWGTNSGKAELELPDELQNAPDIHTLLYFTDDAPEGLIKSLNRGFPRATNLSLVGSSTPFITGRPFTLLRNSKTFSEGAVGIALTGAQASLTRETGFEGLSALSKALTVTSSQSNMVHTLDNANPSQMLVNLLNQKSAHGASAANIRKEDEYYLGLLRSEGDSNMWERVYRITSGNPSRGSLSIEGDSELPEGSRVQFLCRSADNVPVYSERLLSSKPSASLGIEMRYLTSLPDHASVPVTNDGVGDDGVTVIPNAFVASSENGFISGAQSESAHSWRCSIPGGWTSLKFA